VLKYQRATILILLLICVSSSRADASFDGDWVGGFKRQGSLVIVQTHFHAAQDGTTGTIDVIDLSMNVRLLGKPLDNLELNLLRTRFELVSKASHLSFEGSVTKGVMTGVVEESGKSFPFRLDLIAKVDPAQFIGTYQVGARHFITMLPAHLIDSLISFDSESGQMILLLPRTKAEFVCWPGANVNRVETNIRFMTNQLGKSTMMRWKVENAPALIGTPIKLREKEVLFKNGETTLSGTVVLPPTKGPHPAVVLVHGSGPGVRETYRSFASFFALNGIAALMYDKRGCGTSTGDWRKSGFEDFAGDAVAGLEMLKNRPDINTRQIGLWGVSQGGWIVGLAAARSTNVAFIISVSGPGITPEAQDAFVIEHRMKGTGFSDADLGEALSLYHLDSHCAQTGTGWDEFEATRRAVQNRSWYNDDVHPHGPGDQQQWQLIWNYDPVLTLRNIHCPVLSIFGELDPLVPVQKSADVWKTALMEAGNQDVTVKIFPHADHGISDTRDGLPLSDYFIQQRDWLSKHVTVNP
jgi:uncharacterized protein